MRFSAKATGQVQDLTSPFREVKEMRAARYVAVNL